MRYKRGKPPAERSSAHAPSDRRPADPGLPGRAPIGGAEGAAGTLEWKLGHLQAEADSFIIGGLAAAVLAPADLEQVYGGSFYALTWEGAMLEQVPAVLEKLAQRGPVRRVVLCLEPALAAEGSPVPYRPAGDAYSAGWAPDGTYRRPASDSRPAGGLTAWAPMAKRTLPRLNEAIAALRQAAAFCKQQDIALVTVWLPQSAAALESWDKPALEAFYTAAQDMAPGWSFLGLGPVQRDPRYWYGPDHFRPGVGAMMARVLGGHRSPVAGFGQYRMPVSALFEGPAAAPGLDIPVLMYHAFAETEAGVKNSNYVSLPALEGQLAALKEAGYSSVTAADLAAYVETGAPLPDKPILITADDGYLDNLTLAAPVFEKYGYSLSVAVIGVSAGKDTYKDTDHAIIPHFSTAQAEAWADAGVIELMGHSWDMHQVKSLDGPGCRAGMLQQEDEESEDDYRAALEADLTALEGLLGDVTALAYPYGAWSRTSELVLGQSGVAVTMTIRPGVNHVLPGCPESLRLLHRYKVEEGTAGQALLEMIG